MPRKVSKRSYRKRPQKARRSRKRFYRRRFYRRAAIKKPEIHIVEWEDTTPFNNSGTGVGTFINMTPISQVQPDTQYDNLTYRISNKVIEGKKIRLKYLYIKGYIKVGVSTSEDADDFNCKLMVFRWKRNTSNVNLTWETLFNNPPPATIPSTWSEAQRLDMMYKQDWKNDIKINFYKRVKNLYRKYDDANNIIPFKMRIPLYDCVLSCDCYKSSADSKYYANVHPSTNGLYFTFLSNKYDDNTMISWKYKLYYTDY